MREGLPENFRYIRRLDFEFFGPVPLDVASWIEDSVTEAVADIVGVEVLGCLEAWFYPAEATP